jgi:hypothetical protein
MFFRLKKSGERRYVQIVENRREGAAVRQTIIANLGRADELAASGALASLIASGAKLTDQVLLINAVDEDAEGALSVAANRIGGPLLFGRIWGRLGIDAVLADLLRERGFEFPVERAVFVTALHRLFVSGSDRDCASWMEDYDIPGAEGLDLHHFYRAMAWLGEELEEKPAGALAPRCVKDLIEERLFDRRRNLFTDLSAVFMDTTSLSFYGEGGETLGEHGYSKDYRPDLKQMILGLIVDGEGRPICTEMWPGNTADVTALLPVVDRLRQRFSIGRVCVVADRGMISAAAIAGLEERELEYILGARERSDAVVRRIVLENDDPFVPLLVERKAGETQLFVKQVKVDSLPRLPQRARGRERPQGSRSDRRRARCAIEEGRQGADRQLRLSTVSAQSRSQRRAVIRDRRRQARRRGALRRHLRPAHQRQGDAAAGGAALSRSSPSRGPLPADQGDHAHPADLPFLRRRYPRTCLLFLPGAFDAEAAPRSDARGRPRAGMEGPLARSRPPATGAHPLPSRRLARAHRRRARCDQALQMRPCRPAIPRPPGPATAATPVQIRPKTPRPPPA